MRSGLCKEQECCGLGGLKEKEGGLGNRPTSSGKEGGGVRGIFGIFQEPLQSGSRCIPLPRGSAQQWARQRSGEGRKVNVTLYFLSVS